MNGIQGSQKSESARNVSQHIGTGQKRCTKCGEIKVLSEFYRDKNQKDGRMPWCKGCAKEKARARYIANSKKIKQKSREYYAANPEKAKQRSREQYFKDPEKIKNRSREWRRANPERQKENNQKWYEANKEKSKKEARARYLINSEKRRKQSREWQKANPEKFNEIRRNRKARKRNAEGLHTVEDIQKIFEQQGGLCNVCGKKLIRYNKKQYHVDHIIPLAKGGANWPKNIQLLCPTCNRSKSNKDPIKWAMENGRLF